MRPVMVSIIFSMALAVAGCGGGPTGEAGSAPEDTYSPAAQALSLEQRMAIRARMTRIKADAQRAANQVYERTKSHELDVANQELATRLQAEGEAALRDEYGIAEADLKFIVTEYLQNRGVSPVE